MDKELNVCRRPWSECGAGLVRASEAWLRGSGAITRGGKRGNYLALGHFRLELNGAMTDWRDR